MNHSNQGENAATQAYESDTAQALNGMHAAHSMHAALAECPFTATRFTITLPYAVRAHGGQPVLRLPNPLLQARMLRQGALQLPPYWHAMRAVYELTACVLPGGTTQAVRWGNALPENAMATAKWSTLAEWAVRARGVLADASAARSSINAIASLTETIARSAASKEEDAEEAKQAYKSTLRAGRFNAFAIACTDDLQAARSTAHSLLQWCCDVCSIADHGVAGCYEPNAKTERLAQLQAQARAVFADVNADAVAKAAEIAEAMERKRSAIGTLADAMTVVCDMLEDLPAAQWDAAHSALLKSTQKRKLVHGAATLQKLHARIVEHFPDAHFVGDRAAACEELVLQHLCTVMLEQAAKLRAYAVLDSELAEVEEIEAYATADALQSPGGKFFAQTVRKEGVAPAVAKGLQAAFTQMERAKAAATDAALAAQDPQRALERMRDAMRALSAATKSNATE